MFELALPWMLIVLPLPWVVWRFMTPAVPAQQFSLHVPFFEEIEACIQQQKNYQSVPSFFKNKNRLAAYLIWILLAFAASNPLWVGNAQYIPQKGRDLMLAVDLSSSMRLPDMVVQSKQVDRLTAVKNVANQFIDHRAGDRLGLILFGTKAYLQTPLTFDHETVKAMLEDASIGLAGSSTALGDAIGLAVKRLSQSDIKNRVLILLTDGANNTGTVEPLEAARIAASQNIRIYVIGVGSEKFTISGAEGSQTLSVKDQLDVPTLQQIAVLTGGIFFRAKDTESLQHAYNELDKIEPIKSGKVIYSSAIALYPFLLAAALLLSIALVFKIYIKRKKHNDS